MERPVVIPAGPAGSMMAILHEPDRPLEPRVGISLLNPGLKYRVAPNRLNVRLARSFCEMGFFVLRVDPPGIGDSAGDFPEQSLHELWQSVERGALVDGVVTAHKAFRKLCGLSEIIAAGNCGGAITALLACADDPSCRRLILVDVPVATKDPEALESDGVHGRHHGSWVLAAYTRRMTDWRAWLKLFTFRSDFRQILRALRARFSPAAGEDTTQVEAGEDMEGLNAVFLRAFETFDARGGSVLFVNSELHVSLVHFDSLFASRHLASAERARRHPRFTVRGANHIFGMPEWRDELLGIMSSWLNGTGAREVMGAASAQPEVQGEAI